MPADGVVLREGERPLVQGSGKGLSQGVEDLRRVALPGEGRQGRLDKRDDGKEIVVLGSGRQDGMAADEIPLEQLQLGSQRHVAQPRCEPVNPEEELASQFSPGRGLLIQALPEVGGHVSPFSTRVGL